MRPMHYTQCSTCYRHFRGEGSEQYYCPDCRKAYNRKYYERQKKLKQQFASLDKPQDPSYTIDANHKLKASINKATASLPKT